MPFGLNIASGDFTPIAKYDARAGRMCNVDRSPATGEKQQVDITTPPPQFAFDIGSLAIGYVKFLAAGAPDFRMVPVGQPLPQQPDERDDKGRPAFRGGFRAKIYGRVLGGLREWVSAAACVVNAVEDLYEKAIAAPEAANGQIPIVTLTRAIPITTGTGASRSTSYAPGFRIDSWTQRVPDMGERTVPVPKAAAPAMADLDDAIPF